MSLQHRALLLQIYAVPGARNTPASCIKERKITLLESVIGVTLLDQVVSFRLDFGYQAIGCLLHFRAAARRILNDELEERQI